MAKKLTVRKALRLRIRKYLDEKKVPRGKFYDKCYRDMWDALKQHLPADPKAIVDPNKEIEWP